MAHTDETWKRSLSKTASYRIIILILDFTVVYILTGQYAVAFSFMVVSNLYTSLCYYFHERAWDHIHWGRKHPPRKSL